MKNNKKILCALLIFLGGFSSLNSMDVYSMQSASYQEKFTRENFDNGAIVYRFQKNESVTVIKRKKLSNEEYRFKGYTRPIDRIEKNRNFLSKELKAKKWNEFNEIYETFKSPVFLSLKKSH